MKFKKKLDKFDSYENNKKFPIKEIQDEEGTYISFRIDCHWWEIEEMQRRGLVFDYWKGGVFYFKCAWGVNRGLIKLD